MKDRTLRRSVVLKLSQRQLDKLKRSERIEVALFLYQWLTSGNPDEAYLESTLWNKVTAQCLMADMRHWCDAQGIAFHEVDRGGYKHYIEERRDPIERRRN